LAPGDAVDEHMHAQVGANIKTPGRTAGRAADPDPISACNNSIAFWIAPRSLSVSTDLAAWILSAT
jgi:hypothetical protein